MMYREYMDILGSVRESRTSDESTSVKRQSEQIRLWAQMHGHTVIAIAVDEDTSGAVPPFERESLGPWMTTRRNEWDVLVVAKLDRFTRSIRDFADAIDWFEDNGKVFVSVAESMDLSTSTGKMMAKMVALFAEWERERIKERATESRAALRQAGRFGGSSAPYGYRPVKMDGGVYLEPDPQTAPIVRQLIEDAIKGVNLVQLCAGLTADGVKPPSGKKWHWASVRSMLMSKALLGQSVRRDGTVVRNAAGSPVIFTSEPLCDEHTYRRLQAALATRSQVHEPGATFQLRQVAFHSCGQPLAGSTEKKKDGKYVYRYYRCLDCRTRFRADDLEELIEDELLAVGGDREMTRTVVIPGDDHADEIGKLQAQIEVLRDIDGAGELIAVKSVQLDHLSRLPHQPDQVIEESLGITFGEAWLAAGHDERGHVMREAGVRAVVQKVDGKLTAAISMR